MGDRGLTAIDRSKQLRILICGPSGSGKSSLLHCLVYHSAPPPLLGGTIGVRTDVSTTSDNQYTLEWVEVGGTPAHRIARRTFMQSRLDGLILVCDATSTRSYEDALALLEEIVPGLWQQEHQKQGGIRSPPGLREPSTPPALRQRRRTHSSAFDTADDGAAPDAPTGVDKRFSIAAHELQELPILIVANKADALPPRRAPTATTASSGRSSAASDSASHAWYDALHAVDAGKRVKLSVDVEAALAREARIWSYFGPCGMGLGLWRLLQRCSCLRSTSKHQPVTVEVPVIHTAATTCKVPFDELSSFIQRVIAYKSTNFTNHA